MRVKYDESAEGGGGGARYDCPAGTWPAEVLAAEQGLSQSGNPKLVIRYGVRADGRDYTLTSHVPLHVAWRCNELVRCFGEFDTETVRADLVGQSCDVQVEIEHSNDGRRRSEITRIYPIAQQQERRNNKAEQSRRERLSGQTQGVSDDDLPF